MAHITTPDAPRTALRNDWSGQWVLASRIVTRTLGLDAAPSADGSASTRRITGAEASTDWTLTLVDAEGPTTLPAVPGCDRIVLLVAGNRAELDVDGDRGILFPHRPTTAPGEAAVALRPVDGPVRVVDLVTRRGAMTGSVEIARLLPALPLTLRPGEHAVMLTGWADVAIPGERKQVRRLDTVHGLADGVRLQGDGKVAIVTVAAAELAA